MLLNAETVDILDVPIAAVNLSQAIARIEKWIEEGKRTYVTLTGVHGIMESQDDPKIMRFHREAGMCLPDGMPTVWWGQLAGHKNMGRVYGPDLMLEVMEQSVSKGYTHFLYGGKEGVPELLQSRLKQKFPGIKILGAISPPFRPMTEEEEKGLEELIQRLSPDITWVGLGTPKQERWMADHVGKLNSKVLIGVGAAFDFHTGLLRQAPAWIRKMGMEWFFRLCMEPGRLWKRYLKNNSRFLYRTLRQILTPRKVC